jgi:GH24 family phage-related lysozyme (muramidase)/uncharacterized protein (DUF983 family)
VTQQIMKLSKKGLDFIKGWEGFVPFLYDDLVRKNGKYVEWKGEKLIGTLTIGYGHTSAAFGKYPMTVGTRITEARAAQLLAEDMSPVEAYVNRAVKVPLTQGQFDALVSITYNMGEGNLSRSVLLARLNAGDYRGARAAFDLYVNSKGRRLQGLVNRRNAEQILWDTVDTKTVPKQKIIDLAPEEYDARDVVPATPKEIDQPAQPRASTSVEGSSGIATSTVGTGGIVDQSVDAFNKASEAASTVTQIKNTADSFGVDTISIAGVIGTKAYLFFRYLFSSPLFWVFLVITILGIIVYCARRLKAMQEVVPGAYNVAGTPLPQLILGDSGYAGIDTTDDAQTAYYRVDPALEDREYDAPVNIEEALPVKKKRARPRKKEA